MSKLSMRKDWIRISGEDGEVQQAYQAIRALCQMINQEGLNAQIYDDKNSRQGGVTVQVDPDHWNQLIGAQVTLERSGYAYSANTGWAAPAEAAAESEAAETESLAHRLERAEKTLDHHVEVMQELIASKAGFTGMQQHLEKWMAHLQVEVEERRKHQTDQNVLIANRLMALEKWSSEVHAVFAGK